MNNETFDQIYIKENRIPTEQIPYLIESINLEIEFCGEEPVGIILPTTVILEVIEAEPVIKGQTASSSNKPAILSNGVKVMVPTHVEVGSKIIVRTADSTYSSKYKE
jgi:elongation factor P